MKSSFQIKRLGVLLGIPRPMVSKLYPWARPLCIIIFLPWPFIIKSFVYQMVDTFVLIGLFNNFDSQAYLTAP